ncbi:MAG: ABC transporter permease subunit [Deltaproteobacteria bacterium]|nr:ABC transporter permease subunit [Deltaproteobacteria bacterium]
MFQRLQPLTLFFALGSLPMVLLVILPLGQLMTQPAVADLWSSLRDEQVLACIGRSLGTSLAAAAVCCLFGTPLAYLLARTNFPGKRIVEGIIDLPIMIPHPVIGIAILSIAGRNHPLGRALSNLGIEIMGTLTGIIVVLTFVGLPFYVNTVKAGIESVPARLEHVSRSLGAGAWSTVRRVVLPLSWRHMVLGILMSTARAISEFGAIVIVAYHPMTAPVLIYERFTAYGLQYSQPVAFWLVVVSLALFVAMRLVIRTPPEARS